MNRNIELALKKFIVTFIDKNKNCVKCFIEI